MKYESYAEVERTLLDGMLYDMEGENPSKAIEDMEKRLSNKATITPMLPKQIFETTVPIDVRKCGVTLFMKNKERWDVEAANCKRWLLHMYEHLGIKVLGESKTSNAMYYVELPEGWSIKNRPDHHMWKDLCNDKNEVVAEVFFKPCCGYMDEAEIRFVDKPFIRQVADDSL